MSLLRKRDISFNFTACIAVLIALMMSVGSYPVSAEPLVSDNKIHYVVERKQAITGFVLHVRCSFPGNSSGTTEIGIPTDWAGADGADEGIKNLVVETSDATIKPATGRGMRQIDHLRDARITISYDLTPFTSNTASAAAPTNYLPIIQPQYFHLIGWTSWVVPFVSNRTGLMASIEIKSLPSDWSIVTSYGEGSGPHNFAWNLMNFGRSVVIAGDYRVQKRKFAGNDAYFRFATRGNWSLTDSQMADKVFAIVNGLRDFWADKADNDFLVVLSPLQSDGIRSINGTALHQAFVTFATDDVTSKKMDFLWTHEAMHAWLPQKMGRLDSPTSKLAWFTEGFTDYYTHFLRAKWHLLSFEEFAQELNDAFRSLAMSSVRDVDNKTVAAQFHRDREIQRLPYWRGLLLAARWDNEIRRASGGKRTLRDPLQQIMLEAQGRKNVPLTRRLIEDALMKFGVESASNDVDRYIESGQLIALDSNSFDSCLKVEATSYVEFQMGFDYDEAAKQHVIAGVVEETAAYTAGLRNGQTVVTLAQRPRSTETAISMKVLDGNEEKVIVFWPVASRKLQSQKLRVGNVETCKSFFGD